MQAKLWSLNALAVELGRDRRSLARILESLPPDEEETSKSGRVSRRWRMARVVGHLIDGERGVDGEGSLDLNQERARLARAQREKTELEVAVTRGELIRRQHMMETLGRALTAFRARLLSAASKLAPLVNAGNPNLARDLIERELNEALSELADFDPGSVPDEELGEREGDGEGVVLGSEAAPAINGKRVGGPGEETQ